MATIPCPKCKKKISVSTGICLSVIVIFSVLFLIGSCSSDPQETRTTTSVRIGSEGHLTADSSGTDVVLAVNEEAFHEMVTAGTDETLAVMVVNGSCFLAPKGTRVKVLGGSAGASRVLVLDGPATGRTGWIPSEFVK